MTRPIVRRFTRLGLITLVALLARPLSAQGIRGTISGTTPRPAKELIAEAVTKAAADHKAVMVKFNASWCINCRKLDKFLEDPTEVGQAMRANYVIVNLTELETPDKVSLENPGGKEWSKSMGGDLTAMGFPFFVMLDSTGKKIGDSNLQPLTGNIGFPETVEEVAEFDGLLQRTAPHITVADRARIMIYLNHAARRMIP